MTVIVVDDDPDLRESLADLLLEQGYEVRTARNGVEALALLDAVPQRCTILLDWMMPVMGGKEFLVHFRRRADANRFTVLVVSAWAVEKVDGVSAVLKKPFTVQEILTIVHEYERAKSKE